MVFLDNTWRPVASMDPTSLQVLASMACEELARSNATANATATAANRSSVSAAVSATSAYRGEEPNKWAITCTGNEVSLTDCHHKTVESGVEVEISCGTNGGEVDWFIFAQLALHARTLLAACKEKQQPAL